MRRVDIPRLEIRNQALSSFDEKFKIENTNIVASNFLMLMAWLAEEDVIVNKAMPVIDGKSSARGRSLRGQPSSAQQ